MRSETSTARFQIGETVYLNGFVLNVVAVHYDMMSGWAYDVKTTGANSREAGGVAEQALLAVH